MFRCEICNISGTGSWNLSPDFVYVYINRIETNYPVCLSLNIDHLQHLQNSAARFIFDIPQYESAKPYLQQLHWLPVQ